MSEPVQLTFSNANASPAVLRFYNAGPGGGGASDVSDLTADGMTPGNYLRITETGLEELTPAQVLADLGGEVVAVVDISELTAVGEDAGGYCVISGDEKVETWTKDEVKYDLGLTTRHASAQIGTGDAAVTYVAVNDGIGGEAISIEYAAAAVQATTGVGVVSSAITVTPGTKARMVIDGTLNPDVRETLIYAGLDLVSEPYWTTNGKSYQSNIGVVAFGYLFRLTSKIWYYHYDATGTATFIAYTTTGLSYPDGLTFTNTLGTGTLIVTAGVSSASQVAEAVNLHTSAGLIVLATAGGTGLSPVVSPVGATALEWHEII